MTIFNSDDENELIQLGETGSRCQWRVGAIVCQYLKYYPNEKMRVYDDAAKLYGKCRKSIWRYAAVVDFYRLGQLSKDQLQLISNYQFNVLPFEYWATAMQYPDRWYALLEACLREMDRAGGGLPGVDWLRALAGDKIVTSYEAENGLLPGFNPSTAMKQLHKYTCALNAAVNALPLEGDIVTRFVAAMDQLQSSIAEIETVLTQPENGL